MFRLLLNGEEVAADRDRADLLLDYFGDAGPVPEGYHVEEYHLEIDAETRDRLLDEQWPMGERFGELVALTIGHVLPGEAHGYKVKLANRLGMSSTDLSNLLAGWGVNAKRVTVFQALLKGHLIGDGLNTALGWAIVLPDLLRLDGAADRRDTLEAVCDGVEELLAREPQDPGPLGREDMAESEACEREDAEAALADKIDDSRGAP